MAFLAVQNHPLQLECKPGGLEKQQGGQLRDHLRGLKPQQHDPGEPGTFSKSRSHLSLTPADVFHNLPTCSLWFSATPEQ